MIKVLWTVNTFNSKVSKMFEIKSSHSISWVEAMSERIKDDKRVQISIATVGNVNDIKYKQLDGIEYYLVPNVSGTYYWKKIFEIIKPDIIHEYGTEKSHNIYVSQAAKDIPIVVSLQGLLSEYQHHYYAGIDFHTMLRYTPIRDIIRPSGFFSGKRDFIKRSKIEKEILLKTKYVEGRSTWDRVSALNINSNLKYYFCPRMLRRPFYECTKWDINKIDNHTVFISQGNYPIKGVHFVFMAVQKLVDKYPDIRIVVTGNDMFEKMKGIQRHFRTGYQRYLFDLAKKTGVLDRIEYVGFKNADEMAELLKKTHVAVIPSSIENAPNSLAEAMLVGTPCIASFVGGNMDMLKHDEEGYLYCYNEPNMLAEYIDRIFLSVELANKFSNNARLTALKRHDPNELVDKLINIYNSIISNEQQEH